jgi:hypothetical protein
VREISVGQKAKHVYTYAAACAGTGAGVSVSIVPLLLGRGRLAIGQVFSVRLESGDNIQLGGTLAGARTDSPTIDHQTRAVQAADCGRG